MMNARLSVICLAGAALLAAASPALANTAEVDMSFDGMVAMPRIDANKDGRVSRKEFLERMGAVWDMKLRQMKVRGDTASAEDFKQIMLYLKAGG